MKKFLIIFILSFSCFFIHAKNLSPEEALSRAISSSSIMKARDMTHHNMRLVMAEDAFNPTYYIFNKDKDKGQGYLIVSGDDSAIPVLGYAEQGFFDAQTIPLNMRFWLSYYSQQINTANLAGVKHLPLSNGLEDKEPIPPLLSTLWSQNEPYNLLCPIINDQRCVTGCVATALSQIMNFHKYPEHGSGYFSYVYNGLTLDADFENTYYQWPNMLDNYNNNYTEEEAVAVATLMVQTGIAFEMNYSPVSSGAYSDMPVRKLPIYFDYDDNMFFAYRCYHSYAEWHQLVYDQLANVGPVEINGRDDLGSGHSFICDGYDGEGYFHINWGWGGLSDGFFLLDALNPDGQGIGGALLGFTNRIAMQGGIQPSGAIYVRQELVADQFTIKEGTYSTVSYLWGLIPPDEIMFQFIFVNNFTHRTLSGQMGAKFINDITGEEIVLELPSYFEYAYGEGGNPSIKITTPNDIPNGQYTVTPCWRESDGPWQEISILVGATNSVSITVQDKQWIVAATHSKAVLECDNLQTTSQVEWGKDCAMHFTLHNTGNQEYYGTIRAVLKNEYDEICGLTPSIIVSIAPDSEEDFVLSLPFIIYTITEPKEGNYSLCLVDSYLTKISNAVTVYLTPNSGSIDSVMTDQDENVIVYTLGGIKVFEGKRRDLHLPQGHFIIISAPTKN